MNRKGSAKMLLIALLAVLAVAAAYFFLIRTSPEVVPETTPTSTTTSTQSTTTPPAPTPVPKKSGIKGKVIGHYCSGVQPAEPPPDYQPCGEEPLASFSLRIIHDASGVERKATTDSTGAFQIELSPGNYTVAAGANQAVIGGPFKVQVTSGVFIDTRLTFEELRA